MKHLWGFWDTVEDAWKATVTTMLYGDYNSMENIKAINLETAARVTADLKLKADTAQFMWDVTGLPRGVLTATGGAVVTAAMRPRESAWTVAQAVQNSPSNFKEVRPHILRVRKEVYGEYPQRKKQRLSETYGSL